MAVAMAVVVTEAVVTEPVRALVVAVTEAVVTEPVRALVVVVTEPVRAVVAVMEAAVMAAARGFVVGRKYPRQAKRERLESPSTRQLVRRMSQLGLWLWH